MLPRIWAGAQRRGALMAAAKRRRIEPDVACLKYGRFQLERR
jgi:hypothetical protein